MSSTVFRSYCGVEKKKEKNSFGLKTVYKWLFCCGQQQQQHCDSFFACLLCTANRLPGFVLGTSIDYMLHLWAALLVLLCVCECVTTASTDRLRFFNRQMCPFSRSRARSRSLKCNIYIYYIGHLANHHHHYQMRCVCAFSLVVFSSWPSSVFIVGSSSSRINRW